MSDVESTTIPPAECEPIEIEFDVAGTTEINRDGTPRQTILEECGPQPLVFIGEGGKREGRTEILVLVRRRQYRDAKRYFGVVGVIPGDVIERYARYFENRWHFVLSKFEFNRSESTIGLRLHGLVRPPEPDSAESRWDL